MSDRNYHAPPRFSSRPGEAGQRRKAWVEEKDMGDEGAEQTLMRAILTMQLKHSQNIEVIEQLCQEKQEMAERVSFLEQELACPSIDSEIPKPRCCENLRYPVFDSQFDESTPERNASSKQWCIRDTNDGDCLFSAVDAAKMFSITDNNSWKNDDKKSKCVGLSPQLQADTDRYLQRIRYSQDKKKLQELEQEKYELELEKRRVRASKYGKEFKEMKAREERARELRRKRDERDIQKNVDKEAQENQLKEKEAAMKKSLRESSKISKSWEDIQKEEEMLRQDRIERRKHDIASSSAYPSKAIVDSVERWKSREVENAAEPSMAHSKHLNTQSPAEIASRLKHKQERWVNKLQKEKEALNAKRPCTRPVKAAIELEKRQKLYDLKRKSRRVEKEAKRLEESKRKTIEMEQKKKKLLQSKVPESSRRLTRAAEERARAVRKSFEDSRKKENELKKAEAMKLRRSSEISAFLRSIIGNKTNSASDLTETAKKKAMDSAESFKRNRVMNQKRIKEKLSKRPSLIERHDMTIAVNSAATSALKKFAGVVSGTDENVKFKENESDLFDEDERIQLGL